MHVTFKRTKLQPAQTNSIDPEARTSAIGHGGSNFVAATFLKHALYNSHGHLQMQAPTLPTCYAGLLRQVPSNKKVNEQEGR